MAGPVRELFERLQLFVLQPTLEFGLLRSDGVQPRNKLGNHVRKSPNVSLVPSATSDHSDVASSASRQPFNQSAASSTRLIVRPKRNSAAAKPTTPHLNRWQWPPSIRAAVLRRLASAAPVRVPAPFRHESESGAARRHIRVRWWLQKKHSTQGPQWVNCAAPFRHPAIGKCDRESASTSNGFLRKSFAPESRSC